MANAQFRMFIDGAYTDASDGATFASLNPATEEDWAEAPEATAGDVNAAVMAASRSFEEGPWARMKPAERGRYLRRIGECVRAYAEDFGRLETTDTGKLFRETRWQAGNVANIYDFYAGLADKVHGYVPVSSPDDPFIFTTREPVGVVAGIVPWNSQLQLAAYKIAPALAAGNSVVIKASEHASCALLEFAKVFAEADLPPGVVNIVSGGGVPCGQTLTSHPLVDRITFTGGVETARRVIPNTASNIARLTLELGGKSPVVVFDDADLESATNGIVAGIFAASGQSCAAGSRLIVQEGIHDALIERLIARAEDIRIGDPLDENTQMGPLATRGQRDRIETLLAQTVEQGGRILTGGKRPPQFNKGYYFEPTIVACDDQSLPVVQNELFGPVLSVLRFKDEAEALALANDSDFAFAGGVFSRDIACAMRVARKIRAGRLWINTYRMSSAQVPFGGFKRSGYGRESGLESINDFTEMKTVFVETSGEPVADPFVMR
jgi:aldehyde dehydrogenase (NAD+)